MRVIRQLSFFIFFSTVGLLGHGLFANAVETPVGFCIANNNHLPLLSGPAIAQALGWVSDNTNRCGGNYLEPPFISSTELLGNNYISLTGKEGLFSLHGTSIYTGKVTITENGQQVIANKAYVYREPSTEKYSKIDLIGNVILREPNELVLAQCGQFNFQTKNKSLYEILYRIAIYGPFSKRPQKPNNQQIQQERKIAQLSAWGEARAFKQRLSKVYEFEQASYSTCPPLTNIWKVKASRIILNKSTGRGTARNARVYLKNIPVFYVPYLNFPLDDRRQTGFLWPQFGSSSRSGPYISTPFYWNLAPNYDNTLTPSLLSKRGLQINSLLRYLTPASRGTTAITLLPGDRMFSTFKNSEQQTNQNTNDPVVRGELNRLESANLTRKAFSWVDTTHYNPHWSSSIDINYVSDDYYLKDFRNDLNEITLNQLLQEADLNYNSQYWHFLTRLQGYQTLHPIDENIFENQYIRLPQLVVEGNYPDLKTGLDYFIYNDLTRFDIRKNPGASNVLPRGDRTHSQPGISWLFYKPYFYFTPRLQFALTEYSLQQVNVNMPNTSKRALPIVDIHSGLYFDRNISFFSYALRQTLEPQIYYTYVPYRNQNNIPIFDTTINTLTYDQLFNYNRFSGLDRIGDANQISLGVSTRFIDPDSGFEKMRAGIGQIIYFQDRLVTLCDEGAACNEIKKPEDDLQRFSPISAVLVYNLTPLWSVSGDAIWDPKGNDLNNQTLNLKYTRDTKHAISLSYTFVRNGDPQLEMPADSDANNLAQTDLSFTWPLTRDWSTIGRWTQSWNQGHFQNLLYGLEYDSCCWALRLVGGRVFTNQTSNNSYQYNTEFYVQFALKGLGSFGSGNPGHLINSTVIANKTYFGQDF